MWIRTNQERARVTWRTGRAGSLLKFRADRLRRRSIVFSDARAVAAAGRSWRDVKSKRKWTLQNHDTRNDVFALQLPMAITPDTSETMEHHERFWRKVDKSNAAACWPWTGGIDQRSGYGKASTGDDRRSTNAHRMVLEIAIGRRLEPDEHALHADGCVKSCCNPAHLRIGTHTENMADIRRVNVKARDDADWDLEIVSASPKGLELQEQIAPFFAHLYPQRKLRARSKR